MPTMPEYREPQHDQLLNSVSPSEETCQWQHDGGTLLEGPPEKAAVK
jgi:hypothetical protein